MKSANSKSRRSLSSPKPRNRRDKKNSASGIESIKQLLFRGALKEARADLGEYLGSIKVSSVEAGTLYAEIALLYLRMNRMVLENYGDFQNDVIKELKDLNIKEKILTQ